MNNRSFVVPLLAAIALVAAIGYLVRDFFLTTSVSYIALLTILLLFWKPGGFLLLERMQQAWDERSAAIRTFVVEGCSHEPPKYVIASPKAILDDANLFNEAKFKYLLNETKIFVEKVTDDLRTLVFLNILLLIALIIVVSNSSSPVASQAATSPPAVTSASGAQTGSAPAVGTVGSTGAASAPGPTPQPLRYLLSYTAIALQLAWYMRLLFHYRQKNVDVVATVGAPGSPPDQISPKAPSAP